MLERADAYRKQGLASGFDPDTRLGDLTIRGDDPLCETMREIYRVLKATGSPRHFVPATIPSHDPT